MSLTNYEIHLIRVLAMGASIKQLVRKSKTGQLPTVGLLTSPIIKFLFFKTCFSIIRIKHRIDELAF